MVFIRRSLSDLTHLFKLVFIRRPLLALTLLVNTVSLMGASAGPAQAQRPFYQETTWKPRAILPAADILKGGFWPASPKVHSNVEGLGFKEDRLPEVPASGVHPRVLVTPADVDKIRKNVALGQQAPVEFQVMWERAKTGQGAFYALVAKDEALGKSLAAQFMDKVRSLAQKLPLIESQADRENLWCAERSIVASGHPNPPTEIWSLLDYDYLHGWLSPSEREETRAVIAQLTAGRVSNFMIVPDHFMINNHEGFGMEFIRLLLLIEGEKGFDVPLFKVCLQRVHAMLDWYLSDQGMCFESIKGWLNMSAFVAAGMRDRTILKHSHLKAKMRFFAAANHWENGRWEIRDEMRASAFHVIWSMHYYYPEEKLYDWLYSSTLTSHDFLTDAKARWPNPVGTCEELLLLHAIGRQKDEAGNPLDWTDQRLLDQLKLPLTWKDDERGYLLTRNSGRKDDLLLGFVCKQDFYYGGHEGSETNRLTLWHGGVNWIRDLNMLAVKATFLQNMLTVDGKGLAWPPCPGVWLGVQESANGVTAAGDGKIAYSFSKVMQIHPLDFPSAKLPYYAPFAEGNYDVRRDQQIAFHPKTVEWNDGYAHTDYGPWSGETRLVENYQPNNPMEQLYRTVHLARGKHPYVLVFDDARKDDLKHLYDWNISLPDDVELIEAKNPEIAFQRVEPLQGRESDLLLTRPQTPRDPRTGKPIVKKGDPLFLVRVLWRNSPYGFPVPRLERLNGTPEKPFMRFSHLTIPAISESPEFRILLYPHFHGDPLPKTSWDPQRQKLTVQVGDQCDVYRLGQTDGGRTVLEMSRNQNVSLAPQAGPARPVFEVRGRSWDAHRWRTTRRENDVPEFKFGAEITVKIQRVQPPAHIRFTLDGTEPTEDSALYEEPLVVTKSCTLKAKTFDPTWPGSAQSSQVAGALLSLLEPSKALEDTPSNTREGLTAQVYEKKTALWDQRGFFQSSRIMLPNLDQETPLLSVVMPNFQLPEVLPQRPLVEQAKGFYRFTGWLRVKATGVTTFKVLSCGPVILDIGHRPVIESTGVFHQQLDERRGEAVLAAGWHSFELVVCDPLFWNLATAEKMPFAVTARYENEAEKTLDPSDLRGSMSKDIGAQSSNLTWLEAGQPPAWLEPGAHCSTYDREGKNRAEDYLDIDQLTPLHTEPTTEFKANLRPDLVRSYEAWFYAPQSGEYTFELPARREASAGLGELRAAYQSQLRIGGEIVVQRGVGGRLVKPNVGLKKGWHRFSLRLGSSPAEGTVTYPDGNSLALNAQLVSRSSLVDLRPQATLPSGTEPGPLAALVTKSLWEIYGPTEISLTLPPKRAGEIRYTLDGSLPTSTSPLAPAQLSLQQSTTVCAVAYSQGKAVTQPSTVNFVKVLKPELLLISSVDFKAWDGAGGETQLDRQAQLFIFPGATVERERNGTRVLGLFRNNGGALPSQLDGNLSRGLSGVGFKLSNLKMKDNAITVGLWFQSDTTNGKVFGKVGYNAFGKSYRTLSCSIENGKVRVDPGRLMGGAIQAGTWYHLVVTADEYEMAIYLNGSAVARGEGCATLSTDGLDFFTNHAASVERLSVYNRSLSPLDVQHWYQEENQPREDVKP